MSLFTIFLFYLLAFVQAVPLFKRIVVSPHITNPTRSTVWKVGDKVTVTWDNSTIPPPGNFTGQLLLGFLTSDSENLDVSNPLATSFPLSSGAVQITVPDVQFRTNYIVVLFGDSGNASPQFTITGGSNTTSTTTTATTQSSPTPPSTSSSPPSSSAPPSTPVTSLSSSPSSLTPTPTSTGLTTPTSSSSVPSTNNTPGSQSPLVNAPSSSASASASRSNGALSAMHAQYASGISLWAAAAVLSLTLVL